MNADDIELGRTMRDSVSGFTGQAVAEMVDFSARSIQVRLVQIKEGRPVEAHWFDVRRLEVSPWE